jgi:hypothetical protein
LLLLRVDSACVAKPGDTHLLSAGWKRVSMQVRVAMQPPGNDNSCFAVLMISLLAEVLTLSPV